MKNEIPFQFKWTKANKKYMIHHLLPPVIFARRIKTDKGNALGVRLRKYYFTPGADSHACEIYKNTPHPFLCRLHHSQQHNFLKTHLCSWVQNRNCRVARGARTQREIPPRRRGAGRVSVWVGERDGGIGPVGWKQHVPEDPGGISHGALHPGRHDLLIGQRQQVHGPEPGECRWEVLLVLSALRFFLTLCFLADWADGAQPLWVYSPMWSRGNQT